ncbi:molecular chaperone [Enterobacter cloacae complex sp. P3B]|uniref:fimbrial biogenesis chaperone n=1 Tax=Enterobacter TaxID=547 RepID=UPI001868A8E3|nr:MULTISPECIES: molecular chaperone [Enterobacter]MBE3177062.1 molecular chaperone [Enterobacter cloacae complex sp. P26RS]MBE3432456.1 molecular chaperone [Enterobacter cloacae complex sp. P21RS]MBE3458467.1 molecular chaperone [Enterobacter cloacae complex sp. P21C]MBE3497353.1 molecular chaperone [Enterobacter cloacae complex sp. P2B]MBE3502436.1 molecular chaperone [Enterobacter cloacae complex sp. I11]
MNFLSKTLIAWAVISASVSAANAGVIIGGTRVVYDGNKKEASIDVNNPDKTPYLIQSWVETLNGGAEKAPFIITPPLYRLDGGQQNIERVVVTGNLPQDKESLYWLNIKAIPSAPKKDNTLQIAIKTRIKLIYRPAGLKSQQPQELSHQLTWRRNGNQLQVTNPTSYVINFNEISLGGKKIENVSYVLPGESMNFTLPAGANSTSVNYKVINDYGAVSDVQSASL